MPLSSSLLQRPPFGGLNLTHEGLPFTKNESESPPWRNRDDRVRAMFYCKLNSLDWTQPARTENWPRCVAGSSFLRVCANSLLLWFLSVSGGNDVWGHLLRPCAEPLPCASAGVFFRRFSRRPFLRPREGICAWNQLLERTVSSNASTPACNLCFDRWISITPHWVEFLFLPSSSRVESVVAGE